MNNHTLSNSTVECPVATREMCVQLTPQRPAKNGGFILPSLLCNQDDEIFKLCGNEELEILTKKLEKLTAKRIRKINKLHKEITCQKFYH